MYWFIHGSPGHRHAATFMSPLRGTPHPNRGPRAALPKNPQFAGTEFASALGAGPVVRRFWKVEEMQKLACLVLALAIVAPAAALADKVMTGAEVQRALSGKRFSLACADGTKGSGSYNGGTAQAAYTRPSSRDDAGADSAAVRAQGHEICLNWKKLNGGGEGCYGVVEKAQGSYRLASANGGWCDITLK